MKTFFNRSLTMKKFVFGGLLLLAVSGLITSCNVNPEDPLVVYEEELNGGWIAFTLKKFDLAYTRFHFAIDADSARSEAYSGLGWILLKQDSLNQAVTMFEFAELQKEPDASLFAGHAFALNALKNYSASNQLADIALLKEPGWIFPYLPNLNYNDLIVMKAENYFMLGNFTESLTEVQKVNQAFQISVITPYGIAALASEIERLKRF